jgi:hypothetical protein
MAKVSINLTDSERAHIQELWGIDINSVAMLSVDADTRHLVFPVTRQHEEWRTFESTTPANKWEELKDRYFPRWLKARFPVRTVRRVHTYSAMFDKAELVVDTAITATLRGGYSAELNLLAVRRIT